MRTQSRLTYHLEVIPSQFVSFDDVLNEQTRIVAYEENDFPIGSSASNILFSKPLKMRMRKLILYYDPAFSLPLNFKKELMFRGYKFVDDAHPSLLINSNVILTDRMLEQIGIPWYVSILLPSEPIVVLGVECYFSIQRDMFGNCRFKMHQADYIPSDCAILVEKF